MKTNKKEFGTEKKPSKYVDLILIIDKDENIVKLNEECERVSGYDQNHILHQNFFDVLTPKRYLQQWQKVIDKVRENKLIDDFSLPLLTNHGHEIMIFWSSFPVKDKDGVVEDIGLVGQIVADWDDSEKTRIVEDTNFMNPEYFDEFERVITELEKKNHELEKKNIALEKKLDKLKNKDNLDIKTDIVGKSLYTFSDIFGNKKQREELSALMKDLDDREKRLNKIQKKIENERFKIIKQKNDFIRWREKLEQLESDIESRYKWVINKEQALEKHSLKSDDIPRIKSDDEEFSPDVFDQIQDSAAVIQRGVFKQINSSFADLLGYDINEIIDKSIFDFIEPEGLSGFEEYYFNRLKGDDISDFDTMFLTKDNFKILVEVSTKPIIFNGEKAEIVVFRQTDI
jgi:PAS domain S-box-containing protein